MLHGQYSALGSRVMSRPPRCDARWMIESRPRVVTRIVEVYVPRLMRIWSKASMALSLSTENVGSATKLEHE